MDDVDERIDALFAGAPGDFTAGRDAVAKELRAAGDRGRADRVRALRRPTRLAAEMNRIAREHADGLAAVLAAEEDLAAAQAAVLDGTGDAAALGAAAAAETAAVAELSDDPAVCAALRTAARDEGLRDDLRAGRLSADPEAGGGGGLFAFGPPPAGTRGKGGAPTGGSAKGGATKGGATKGGAAKERGATGGRAEAPAEGGDELATARARRVRRAALGEARGLVDRAAHAEREATEAHATASATAAAARQARETTAAALDGTRAALVAAEAEDAEARRRAEAADAEEAATKEVADAAARLATDAREALVAAEADDP